MTVTFNQNGFAVNSGIVTVYTATANGLYIGQAQEYVSAGGSLAAGSYLDAPPAAKAGFAIVRSADGWAYQADNRGTYYRTDTGAKVEHTELGALPDNLTALAPLDEPCKWDNGKWVVDTAKQAENHAQFLAQMITAIDNKAATIYQNWTRFEAEYNARKAAAQAYKDAGYKGEVSTYITSFAIPAGLDNKAAADLILAQAAGLQKLQDHLAALRMRKYGLKQQGLTLAQMQDLADAILKEMDDLMEAYNNA